LFDQRTQQFTIRRGPVFANFLLVDEVNRAPAKTQAALLEVMQEQQVTIEGESFALQLPFMALATQNPIEHEGTYPLPEAQLDRFLLKVVADYPDEAEEAHIVRSVTDGRIGNSLDVEAVRQVLDPAGVQEIQRQVATTLADDRIVAYAVRIARETRGRRGIMFGAGPRGAIALVRAARARAVIEGRDFVTPDDVRDVALPALRHRIVLSPEMEIEGVKVDRMLESILDTVEAPRA
jgi:MoxR-like ATPase